MSIVFRVTLPADQDPSPHAEINARQLAALRRLLRTEGTRLGLALIEPDEVLGDTFEARVCPLALAAVTALFDHAPEVIAIVEEAQFRGRRLSIHHCPRSAAITMRMAMTSDADTELDLAYGNAYALLEALGLDQDSIGEIALVTLHERLADPDIAWRAQLLGVEHYLPRLARLTSGIAQPEEARFSWA
jgi:hypothetical protein